jgi:hypothetical protein
MNLAYLTGAVEGGEREGRVGSMVLLNQEPKFEDTVRNTHRDGTADNIAGIHLPQELRAVRECADPGVALVDPPSLLLIRFMPGQPGEDASSSG